MHDAHREPSALAQQSQYRSWQLGFPRGGAQEWLHRSRRQRVPVKDSLSTAEALSFWSRGCPEELEHPSERLGRVGLVEYQVERACDGGRKRASRTAHAIAMACLCGVKAQVSAEAASVFLRAGKPQHSLREVARGEARASPAQDLNADDFARQAATQDPRREPPARAT